MQTGHPIVDAVSSLHLSGNVIPHEWYRRLRTARGPDFPAITILGEVVFFYRAKEEKDEATGVVTYHKRFKADLLQKSYAQLAEQFGFSKERTKQAIDRLVEVGVLTREFRNVTYSHIEEGQAITASNVMFLGLVPEKLAELSDNIIPGGEGGITGGTYTQSTNTEVGIPSSSLPVAPLLTEKKRDLAPDFDINADDPEKVRRFEEGKARRLAQEPDFDTLRRFREEEGKEKESEEPPPHASEANNRPLCQPPTSTTHKHNLLFAAICEVCCMDFGLYKNPKDPEGEKSIRGRIGKAASKIRRCGYTPDQVRYWYGKGGWWYYQDWRGKKGEWPWPEAIWETIARPKALLGDCVPESESADLQDDPQG